MSSPDKKHARKLYVGEELTKVTIVQELSNAVAFLKKNGSSKQSSAVCIDFIKLNFRHRLNAYACHSPQTITLTLILCFPENYKEIGK